jgi:hypothetical protein
MNVNHIIVRAHAPDLDASVVFYEKLRFTVREDAAIGDGTRVVQMIHADMSTLLLILREMPGAEPAAPVNPAEIPEDIPVLFTLVIRVYLDWIEHLEAVGVPLVARASHPWGVWLIVKDPAGNAVSLSTWDFY